LVQPEAEVKSEVLIGLTVIIQKKPSKSPSKNRPVRACFFFRSMLQSNLLIFWEVLFLSAIQIIVSVFHIIFSLSIIVIVLFQSGKSAGLSGAIAGGAETFFGKNKGRTLDALLSKYTSVAAVMFLITSVILFLILG